ncbi:MAG: hypothetical protein KDD55_10630 [Bdellovibrionales bacterium]|nr:hypothetical protein [Bdellovibrionales bacterium]
MSTNAEHSNLAHKTQEPGIDETVVMSDLFQNYTSSMAQYRAQQAQPHHHLQRPESLMQMRIRNGMVSRILTALGF